MGKYQGKYSSVAGRGGLDLEWPSGAVVWFRTTKPNSETV